jgi:hypothetical protein
MPVTCTEVLATFRELLTFRERSAPDRNYMRFRISPEMEVAGIIVMGLKETWRAGQWK